MSAVGEAHAHDCVAGIYERGICRHVSLRTRVRLNVGAVRTEELFCALDSKIFNDVNIFAAAVIALAGIALCIFIGQNGAGCQQHRLGDDVLAGNQLNVIALALQLQTGCVVNLFIVFCKLIQKEHGNSAILSSIAVL